MDSLMNRRDLHSDTGSLLVDDQTALCLSGVSVIKERERISYQNQVSPLLRQSSQLHDKMKYSLKPTDSLSTSNEVVQVSQENPTENHPRKTRFSDEKNENMDRVRHDDYIANKVSWLNADLYQSLAEYDSPTAELYPSADRSGILLTKMAASTNASNNNKRRTSFSQHISDFLWIFLAVHLFTIILFSTRQTNVNVIFSLMIHMIIQTLAFGAYIVYKSYNLFDGISHKIPMIAHTLCIAVAISISFFAYDYITIAEIITIRQIRFVLVIVISICFLDEHATAIRILSWFLCVIALLVLSCSSKLGFESSFSVVSNRTEITWNSQKLLWDQLFGIALALTASLLLSIASIIKKHYLKDDRMPSSVRYFWSALVAVLVSLILLIITHFSINEFQFIFHGGRLFITVGLAFASLLVSISQEKAAKRVRVSILNCIYSTDIIMAIVLENFIGKIRSDSFIFLTGFVVLFAVLMVCFEMLQEEKMNTDKVERYASIKGQQTQES